MSKRSARFRGDRLRSARQRIGLTQDELANDLALGQAQVNRYELNKSEPSTKTLSALASRLGVSADWLLGLVDGEQDIFSDDGLSEVARKFAHAAESGDFKKIIEMALEQLND